MTAGWAEMTKARSKAARRRRANVISLPGGQAIAERPVQGRRVDLETEPADRVALTYRAKITGCTVEDARDVLAGSDMGRCIRHIYARADDRRDLLSVWQGISAAWENYLTRYVGITPTAQSSSLPMLPEPMQTDPSLRVDLRTPTEKDAAALRVWQTWCTAFNRLSVEQSLIITAAAEHKGPRLWNADDHLPTKHGRLAVYALRALHIARRA